MRVSVYMFLIAFGSTNSLAAETELSSTSSKSLSQVVTSELSGAELFDHQ